MTGRNAYDSGASGEVQTKIKSLSGQIQAAIEQHKANVKAMRADASMTQVMEEYDAVEAQFDKAAAEVLNIIKLLGDTLKDYDDAADTAFRAASKAVQNIPNT